MEQQDIETILTSLRQENASLRRRVAELDRARDVGGDAPVPYTQLFESAPIALRIYALNGRLVDANAAVRVMEGWPEVGSVVKGTNLLDEERARASGCVEAFERARQGEHASVCIPSSDASAGGAGMDPRLDGRIERWIERSFAPIGGSPGATHILEMIRDVTQEQAMRRDSLMLHGMFDNGPFFLYAKDRDGRYILINNATQARFNVDKKKIIGVTDHDMHSKEIADSYRASEIAVMESGKILEREDTYTHEDGTFHYFTSKFPMLDEDNQIFGVCSLSLDVSRQKQAEIENQRLQEEIIRIQEETLRALSTPLMPIATGVLAMPLIGHVDHERAQRVLEALLNGIVAQQAQIVILDVTGVPAVDHDVGNALLQVARAAGLLGTEVVLTGIQPKIAQTLVDIDADLGGIVTKGTLQGGIAYALRRRR